MTPQNYRAGDLLPEVTAPVIDRMRLAYMTVSMRDPNPVHIEDEFAAKAGLPSVIAHGTFAITDLAFAVAQAAGIEALTRLRVELLSPVFPGDTVRTRCEVVAVHEADGASGRERVDVELAAYRGDGTKLARGTATFRQPRS